MEEFDDIEDFDGIIEEENNDDVIIHIPFDPNKIKVKRDAYSVGQIVQDLKIGIININTEFQRLPNLWDEVKKSRFIESLLLNLPLPAFYFNEGPDNSWEIIDGLQRVSTINSFVVEESLVLKNLEFLKEFNGKKFSDLPNPLQIRITRFNITIYIIEKGTPIEVKYNIFKRVNTGGLTLTAQEIRHAINQGTPSELIADLVRFKNDIDPISSKVRLRKNHNGTYVELKATKEGKTFGIATGHKISSIRMEDRDFATRFVSFYLIPYASYQPDLDTFLNKGLESVRKLKITEIEKLKEDFTGSLNTIYNIFGDDSFRKRFNKNDRRKPINKALFEILSVSIAKLTPVQRGLLMKNKNIFKNKFIKLHNEHDGKFLRSITSGTAQKELVNQRFSDMQNIIKETLQND